ncbi:MAG TPA: hypothetical protein PK200_07270 [Spirochaetota bacterium]|nr:hypothetical protein [Spirochaetota bacterium]HQO03998.1 hypothetical protein [Spirochaetota bacterium]HQP48242.1 hypothetical protein [Spirochaetota bacterium]
MDNFVSVIFCSNCGSRYVEIREGRRGTEFYCRTCQVSETVSNFTLGHCRVTNTELQGARDSRGVSGGRKK